MSTNSFKQIDVVAGLIYRDGRVLACQRHEKGSFPLKWEFPGGKIEVSETAGEALRRELKEELAIDVLESAEVYQHGHRYPRGPNVHLRFYKVLRYGGEIENRVFQQITWVELADLHRLDFLDGDKPLIDKLVTADGAEILV